MTNPTVLVIHANGLAFAVTSSSRPIDRRWRAPDLIFMCLHFQRLVMTVSVRAHCRAFCKLDLGMLEGKQPASGSPQRGRISPSWTSVRAAALTRGFVAIRSQKQ